MKEKSLILTLNRLELGSPYLAPASVQNPMSKYVLVEILNYIIIYVETLKIR